MGKASRKKRQTKPDLWTLFQAGTCGRCEKRPRIKGGVWCVECHANGRRRRASVVPRRLRGAQLRAVLDGLEAALVEAIEKDRAS